MTETTEHDDLVPDAMESDEFSDDLETDEPRPGMSRTTRAFVDWAVVVGIALLVAILVRTFLLAHFVVDGTSMLTTLNTGDRVFVNKLSYRLHDPNRGDVVVLHQIGGSSERDLIKRVIALPGESWEIRDGAVYIDGVQLDEPYLVGPRDQRNFGPETVPADSLFVLGDNRLHSCDSRFAPDDAGVCRGLGYVPQDNVIGQAFVVIWPPGDMAWLH